MPSGVDVDSFRGTVRVEWDHEAAMTPLGQLPFFIDFLKTAGLFDAFVADCPLRYGSPNAAKKRDVLGTAMLGMLAGAKGCRQAPGRAFGAIRLRGHEKAADRRRCAAGARL